MSVFKKLQELQSVTRSLAPDSKGQTGAAVYGYVSGAKLLSVIRPAMDKLGLLLFQEVKEITNTPMTYQTKSGEKTEMFTTAHIKFTWVDADDGTQVSHDFYANGMNAWDKGLGSCLTYAERYYLLKTFHISTDEDDVDALVREDAETPVKETKNKSVKSGKKTLSVKDANDIAAELFEAAKVPGKWDEAVAKFNNEFSITQEQWNKISEMVNGMIAKSQE